MISDFVQCPKYGFSNYFGEAPLVHDNHKISNIDVLKKYFQCLKALLMRMAKITQQPKCALIGMVPIHNIAQYRMKKSRVKQN